MNEFLVPVVEVVTPIEDDDALFVMGWAEEPIQLLSSDKIELIPAA